MTEDLLRADDTLNRGLVGYWRLDETSTGRLSDLSGNGNHGSLMNASGGAGPFNGSIDLKGRDDSHGTIPTSQSLRDFKSAMTATILLYARSLRLEYLVGVTRQIGNLLHPDQFYLGFGPEHGVLRYKWHLGLSGNAEGDCYDGDPETGRWLHLAGTYDGQEMVLYVDGLPIGHQFVTGDLRIDGTPIIIGAEQNGATPGVVDGEFDGYADFIRLYNRSLTPGEIEAVYKADVRPPA